VLVLRSGDPLRRTAFSPFSPSPRRPPLLGLPARSDPWVGGSVVSTAPFLGVFGSSSVVLRHGGGTLFRALLSSLFAALARIKAFVTPLHFAFCVYLWRVHYT